MTRKWQRKPLKSLKTDSEMASLQPSVGGELRRLTFAGNEALAPRRCAGLGGGSAVILAIASSRRLENKTCIGLR
jgi:hypothetical protein